MKSGIHPKYVNSTITCACGAKLETLSTKPEVNIGICSSCHPFFTGQQKYVDTAGRIEKFKKRFSK